MVYEKRQDNLYKDAMNNGTPLSSSDSEMASKANKNRRATFVREVRVTKVSYFKKM